MKRIFLAIRVPLNDQILSYVSDYHQQFGFMNIRWVKSEYLHMTLKYFGPTDDKSIERIKIMLEKVLKSEESFNINISKLKMFGSKSSPKSLWWGIEEEEKLKDLVHILQRGFDKLGLFVDRQNFVPHITLGRIIKVNSNSFFQKQLSKFSILDPISINVKSLILLESRISKHGPKYIELAEFKL